MSLTTSEMTPADIAAVTNNNGSDGFGGNNGIWWLALLFLFGRNGFGGYGGGMSCGANSACATPADVSAAVAQQTLLTKLDGQTYGIADATFALNNAITGGFASAELSRCQQQAALMAQLSNMAADSAKCCCETQRAIDGVNYGIATQTAAIQNTLCGSTRDILENQNNNARAILDALTAQRLADKDAKIAEQTQTIFGLQLAASQSAQNAYLINQLRQPCPVPAYVVPNPNCCYPQTCGCGGSF